MLHNNKPLLTLATILIAIIIIAEPSTAANEKLYATLGGKVAYSEDSNDEIQYNHKNGVAGTIITTNDAGEKVSENANYPYGKSLNSKSYKDSNNLKFSFSGKEQDFSQLHYFNQRYYDSNSLSFPTIDPVFDSSVTPYRYANNNPINLEDPDGRKVKYTFDSSLSSISQKDKEAWIGVANQVISSKYTMEVLQSKESKNEALHNPVNLLTLPEEFTFNFYYDSSDLGVAGHAEEDRINMNIAVINSKQSPKDLGGMNSFDISTIVHELVHVVEFIYEKETVKESLDFLNVQRVLSSQGKTIVKADKNLALKATNQVYQSEIKAYTSQEKWLNLLLNDGVLTKSQHGISTNILRHSRDAGLNEVRKNINYLESLVPDEEGKVIIDFTAPYRD